MEAECSEFPVVVVDYSGSYTDVELKKSGFTGTYFERNPKKEIITFLVADDVVENIVEAFATAFEVKSILQKRILENGCREVIEKADYFSFQQLYKTLERNLLSEEDALQSKNIEFLMARFCLLKNLDNFRVIKGSENYKPATYILQFSDFQTRSRNLLVQFFLELCWQKIRFSNVNKIRLVLDEYQKVRIEGTCVEEIIREGRKYGIGILFISQYCDKRFSIELQEQASTTLHFQPDKRSLTTIAKEVGGESSKKWVEILKNLDRGECILTGNYIINGVAQGNCPLTCKVQSNDTHG